MKPAFRLPVLILGIGIMLNAQHTSFVPVVNVHGPTIVAFFPNASKIGPNDADGNEALSDFEFYAERVKEPLKQLGIQFTEEFHHSFRVRLRNETILFTPRSETPGYYFVQPGKKPQIKYGVMTDADLLALAKQYFRPSDADR